MTRYWTLLIAAMLLISSCYYKSELVPAEPFDKQMPICLSIDNIEQSLTRALVDDSDTLKSNCTPDGKINESVGLFAEFTYTDPKDNQRYHYHLFKDSLGFTSHVYIQYYIKNPGRPTINWNYYPDEDQFWMPYSLYTFRAYYPAKFLKNSIDASSNVDSLIINQYDTFSEQKDMLIAYKQVNSDTASKHPAVDLNMFHPLAAMRFQFCFADTTKSGHPFIASDTLTSCYLESVVTSGYVDSFASAGKMQYGCKSDSVSIKWTATDFPGPATKFYEWQHNPGLEFKNETNADGGIDKVIATAYSDTAMTVTGKTFADNDGWLLIIPQQYHSENSLYLFFTTKRSGDSVTKVKIPAPKSEPYFKPNYRYTYTIIFTGSDLSIVLSIAPWNRITSNEDIEIILPKPTS